jgi:hypothetical protein
LAGATRKPCSGVVALVRVLLQPPGGLGCVRLPNESHPAVSRGQAALALRGVRTGLRGVAEEARTVALRPRLSPDGHLVRCERYGRTGRTRPVKQVAGVEPEQSRGAPEPVASGLSQNTTNGKTGGFATYTHAGQSGDALSSSLRS